MQQDDAAPGSATTEIRAGAAHVTAPATGPFVYLAQIAAITLLYLAAAWAGHQVAVASDYASPLWPAAGIALAGLAAWGLRLWPGVWLAGLLTDLLITPSGAHWIVSATIAGGIALQAVIGARLVKRFLIRPDEAYRDRELARFVVLAGPLVSLISCTSGMLALLAGSAIEPTQGLSQWLMWWAGDTTGVLLFAPLALALWPGATAIRARWEGGWRVAVIPAVTAALLVGGLLQMTRMETLRIHAEAVQNMDTLSEHALLQLAATVEPLHGVARFFEASREVSREEFARYTEGLHRRPAVIGVDWAPRVVAGLRNEFEQSVKAQGFPDFAIRDVGETGDIGPAAQRADYFPILFSEPASNQATVLGLDHGQWPERRSAMERALAQPGSAHITRAELQRTRRPSVLVYLPVQHREDVGLTGYVVGVLNLDELLERFLNDALRRNIVVRITDISPGAPAVVLEDTLPAGGEPDVRRELAFGGMLWQVDMLHAGGHRDASGLQAVRAYLAFASFAALLVAFAVLGSAGRNAATSARVAERTAELARALKQLRDREAEERAVLDNIVECVVTIDTDGTVLNINRAVEPMFGFTPAEVIGHNVSMLMSESDAAAHDGHLGRYLHTGERHIIGRNREVEGRHRDGHVIALELAVSEYVFGERRVFTGTLRDISERKSMVADLTRAREHADEANRAKSAFLAAMSHEIRTPMNGVVGLVDVLARSSLDEYQRDLVRTIRESSTTLLTLIDDILDFSKIEAGRLEIEQRPLQLAELVEGVCSSLSPIAVRRGVELSLHIDPALPPGVLSDEVRLRQVLFNIIGNAIKFSAGRPEVRGAVFVRVGLMPEAPLRVVFTVSDNGIGISPERLGDLFRPFTQAESSTTRRFGGTGLGLAICKRLADMLGGRIDAESTIGIGSTFRITLPLEAAPQIPPTAHPDLHGVDCLIAPCCGGDADTMQCYLAHAGARVHRPADNAEAARIAGETPLLVVLDCVRNGAATASLQPLGRDVRTVRVTRGRSTAVRGDGRTVVSVDGNVLRRSALLRAVAVAAGRASPDAVWTGSADETEFGNLIAPQASEALSQGRLILVAEDNEINQKVVLHQLALLGYAAEVADDGAQALQMWNTGNYGLLLTDLHMPQMDGYSLTAAIRAAEPAGTRKPILALTANALRGEERRALEVGMDAYLTKPVQLEELRRTLEKFLPGIGQPQAASPLAAPEAAPQRLPDEEAQGAVFDVSVLEELVGDDQEIVREFLEEFRRSAGELADTMRNALAGGWVTEAGNAAHKLKSAARSVGALALGELCATIERKAREEDCTTLSALLPTFDTLLHETGERIGEFLGHR